MSRQDYTEDFKAKVLAEVKKGEMSIPKVAIKFGIPSNSIVYTWLGRTDRKKLKIKPKSYSAEMRQRVLADVDSGSWNIDKIAEKHGIHPSTVYWWVRERRGDTTIKHRAAVQTEVVAAITPNKNDNYMRDVMVFLRHSRTAANHAIRTGQIKNYDKSHLLMMLALAELEVHGN